MLVKLGDLTVTANTTLQHRYNAEVQFRALFAMINLVIPSEFQTEETNKMEMLDASVAQTSN